MKLSNTQQRTLIIAATVLIAFAMIWVNTWYRSRQYFREGEDFYRRGLMVEAITSYETAIHAYTPFNSNVKRSAEMLWKIGNQLRVKPDLDLALIAFRSLRSSFYAVRSLYTPYPEWIEKAEQQIEAILKLQEEEARSRLQGMNAEQTGSATEDPSAPPDVPSGAQASTPLAPLENPTQD